jgi:heat shock protein 4
VAVARNRGIDVIANETSNRATPSLVSLTSKQRAMGEQAKTLEISNFKNTVANLKRLIARPFSDPDLAAERPFINCDLVEDESGQVAASLMYKDEQTVFTFVQLCAMYFTKVKEFTSEEIGTPVTDCVISVPVWFNDQQRRAIMDAAQVLPSLDLL